MTRLAIPAAIAAVMLGIYLSIKRRANKSVDGTPEYPDLIPMTWPLPDGYAATYRYILGPTGVPSSLN